MKNRIYKSLLQDCLFLNIMGVGLWDQAIALSANYNVTVITIKPKVYWFMRILSKNSNNGRIFMMK